MLLKRSQNNLKNTPRGRPAPSGCPGSSMDSFSVDSLCRPHNRQATPSGPEGRSPHKGRLPEVGGWRQVVSMGCPCGLGSKNQLAPFHNRPRLSLQNVSKLGKGGWRDRQAVNPRDAEGRGWCRPRLPDSYFGVCCDGPQPWQGEASTWELWAGALPGRGRA